MSWLARLQRWAPITRIDVERVSFDTQLMQSAEISGIEYQHGTLYGTEVRQYVLAKWNHRCAYCGAKGVPLNLDHVIPKSRGGSDRVSNIVAACIPCNDTKDSVLVEVWLKDRPEILRKIKAQMKAPLRDAAAVQSTRNALFRQIEELGVPVGSWSGGRTKWNRQRNHLPKTHAIDGLCVGEFENVYLAPKRMMIAKASGRGRYSRTLPTKHGFPRAILGRTKQVHGFQTGDLVKAVVPKGKHAGTHVGRIAVRGSGSMRVGQADGVRYRHCSLIQRGNGYELTFTPILELIDGEQR